MKYDVDVISRILGTIEQSTGTNCGIDVRLMGEKLAEANRRLQDIGIFLELKSVPDCIPVDGRLMAMTANVRLVFKTKEEKHGL